MADDKKQMEPEDRLIYEPEEIKRMVDEYNKQKQIEYVDLHTEKICRIISIFNIVQSILLILWVISLVISAVEIGIQYPIRERTVHFGRRSYPLTSLVLVVAVIGGEYIGGLNKIGGTIFTTLGGAFALWITKEYAEIFSKLQITPWFTVFFVVTAYLCCLLMNFHPVINRYLKRFSSKQWFNPGRDKKK